MNRVLTVAALAGVLMGGGAWAQTTGGAASPSVGQDLKGAGHDTAAAGKTVGQKTASGTKTAAKDTANGTKTVAHKTASGTKTAAAKVSGKPGSSPSSSSPH